MDDTIDIARSVSKKPTKSTMKVSLNNKRMLFKLNGGFGDALMLTPLFRWLKKNIENVKIELAVPPIWMQAFDGDPNIDIVLNGLDEKELQKNSRFYNVKIDFGYAITGNEDAEKMHAVDAYFRWMDRDFDLDRLSREDRLPNLTINPYALEDVKRHYNLFNLDKRINIALQLSTSSFIRTWSQRHNETLGRMLAADGFNVLLFDQNSAHIFNGDNIYPMTRFLKDISESIAMLSLCDIIVAPDSAFIHIAQALGKPFVGMYGAFPAEFRMKYADNGIGLECDREEFTCSPCLLHRADCPKGIPSPCMDSITPEMVYKGIRKLAMLYYPNKFVSRIDTSRIQHRLISCSFCLSKNIFVGIYEKGLKYVTCNDCGSLSQWNRDDNKSIVSPLNDGDFSTDKDEIQFLKSRIETLVDTYLQNFGKIYIADLGCKDGALINVLRGDGIMPYAVDISLAAKRSGLKKYGLNIDNKDICEDIIYKPGLLNIAILNQVLEHFSAYDIKQILARVHLYLHRVGYLYIYAPTSHFSSPMNGGGVIKETHLNIPSPSGITELLATSNFDIIETNMFLDRNYFEIIATKSAKEQS